MEDFDIQEWITKAENLSQQDILILGGGLIFCIILLAVFSVRRTKKRRAKRLAPNMSLQNLLVAPLGKGVQIKIINSGEQATVTDIEIKGRTNVNITQGFKEYEVQKNKFYNVFCEADEGRADTGFDMEIEYRDQIGNQYRQRFHIEKDKTAVDNPKLVRYA